MIRDLTDDEARAALPCKWGEVAPDVLPAWVAEMDYAVAEPVREALLRAVTAGMTGYPPGGAGGALGDAYAGFAARQFGATVDPARVVPTVDVTAGVRIVLDVLAPAGGLVFPVPGYSPQLAMADVTGRERLDLVVDPDAERAELDLDRLDRFFADGARVLLLTQPHNPWGRAFSRAELEGVRDVVVRHGGFVVSDEIHAPLVLDGREHVSYLAVDGTADHAVSVVSPSKAFNTAGLKCAQLVTASDLLHERLLAAPGIHNDSWSVLGLVAAEASYTHGDAWLAALRRRLEDQRDLLVRLLAEHLPLARLRPVEATYLAWVDLRAYGHDDPAALALERERVRLAPGHDYQPGLTGHVRLNFATSADRLTTIVHRLAAAVTLPPS
ncbi:MalY/PatB family protein [Nocardioides sp.]|uniref:MalY/PatB family protein n=1 Tax=Nocardioides sp. TaxID=35761 RepID=UPI0027166AE8|nr:aminotransferase class I/II-fold pyridoxal phosphate-dependent enzyme [Nocardioides sp.]MDO9457925.1 aminotransferase class I/II-fold pyridoxal phosphate-dependent enzyme [Nocardioides sp.]